MCGAAAAQGMQIKRERWGCAGIASGHECAGERALEDASGRECQVRRGSNALSERDAAGTLGLVQAQAR